MGTADQPPTTADLGRTGPPAEAEIARLREREAQLTRALDAAGLATWDLDHTTGRFAPSPRLNALLGLPPDLPLSADDVRALYHPDDRERLRGYLVEQHDPAVRAVEREFRIVRPDGQVRWLFGRGEFVRDPAGQVVRSVGMLMDVTERRLAEEALRERDERLQAALSASQTGTFRWDLRSGALDWDDSLYRLFGRPPGTVRSIADFEALVHPDDRPALQAALSRHPGQQEEVETEYRVIRPDGTVIWIADKGRIFFGPDGRPAYMTGACADITARKRAEAALRASHDRIEEILESMDEAFYALDHEGRLSYVNARAETLWGRHRAEVLGRHLWEVFPNFLGSESHQAHLLAAAERRPVRIEPATPVIGRPVELSIYPSPSGLSVYLRDISELKQALAAKDLALRELHHRVNNTMQLIVSVLNLQTSTIRDPAARRQLEEAQLRVRALADVQRRLYDTGPVGTLAFGGYLRDICRDLSTSLSGTRRCDIAVTADERILPGDQAISLALIANELITNAVKYAYPGDADVLIRVDFAVAPDGGMRLTVADEGMGLPAGFDPAQSTGLGMRLVAAMVRKLRGTFDIEQGARGARFVVTCPGDSAG